MARLHSKRTNVAQGKYLKIPVMGDYAYQTIGSEDWFRWLEAEGNRTIYVHGDPYSYTARREKRRQKYYWYAFKKANDMLHKVYMGQSHKLTAEYIFKDVPQKLDAKLGQYS